MKHTALAMAATILLTACFGAPPNEKILATGCQDIFRGDARIIQTIVTDAGTNLEDYCSCYAKTIVAGETKIDLHKDVVQALVLARNDGALGAEAAASIVEEQVESGEIDLFTEDQLDQTGEDFQQVSEEIGDNGGACPI